MSARKEQCTIVRADRVSVLRSEHQGIEEACDTLRWFGLHCVLWCAPHSFGPGWYAWSREYPEEGSAFLGCSREIVTIAKCIVRHERAAGLR